MEGVKAGALDQMVLRRRFKNILGPTALQAATSGHLREPQGRDSYWEGQSSSTAAPEAQAGDARPARAREQRG
jgi:hypothetical protein